MLLFHYIDDFSYFLVFRVFVLLIFFIICDDSNGKNLLAISRSVNVPQLPEKYLLTTTGLGCAAEDENS